MPISSDAKALDGLNVHVAVCDEIGSHKTPEVYNILVTAMGTENPEEVHMQAGCASLAISPKALSVGGSSTPEPIETSPRDGTHILVIHDLLDLESVAYWHRALQDLGSARGITARLRA